MRLVHRAEEAVCGLAGEFRRQSPGSNALIALPGV
jgi:hypothetical protein